MNGLWKMMMASRDIGGSQRGVIAAEDGKSRHDVLCGHLRAALNLADEGGDVLLGAKLQDVLCYAEGHAASSSDHLAADRPD